ncbi:MAG: cytochrome c [Polyangiaceae bacterium]|nr:cytochrome c [Polyangiaceae bacterium]
MRRRRDAARAVGLGALLAWPAGCRAEGDLPGYIVLPEMVESVPFDSWAPNPVMPLGQTLSRPPAGTVPVGGPLFAFGPGPEEAARAGRELTNPLQATSADLLRGKKLFATYCQLCHGPQGLGDGQLIGRFPRPPSLVAEHARGLPDGQIFHIVSQGQGNMPPHGVQILPVDRWRLVLHVRSLQGPRP